MITPITAQEAFDTTTRQLEEKICRIFDSRLISNIRHLQRGGTITLTFDVIVRRAFEDDEYSKALFPERRELIIESIREAYQNKDWNVAYGTIGQADLTNKTLNLVFSIPGKTPPEEDIADTVEGIDILEDVEAIENFYDEYDEDVDIFADLDELEKNNGS